jgi:signal peptidase I
MTEKKPLHDPENFETRIRPEEDRERRPGKKRGGLLEFLIILLVAFALVFGVVRPFVVEAFYIPSESMVPTLEVGDRVFVNKFKYRLAVPQRGEIVVFESLVGGEDEDLIKRVVALPGDLVFIRDGVLYVNEKRFEEPYVNKEFPDDSNYPPDAPYIIIPPGEIFVMGDNRTNSRDSRFIGPISIEKVEGEAFVVFWPPSNVGIL